jgi:hypothetical protein
MERVQFTFFNKLQLTRGLEEDRVLSDPFGPFQGLHQWTINAWELQVLAYLTAYPSTCTDYHNGLSFSKFRSMSRHTQARIGANNMYVP